jgi:hypothetical protein
MPPFLSSLLSQSEEMNHPSSSLATVASRMTSFTASRFFARSTAEKFQIPFFSGPWSVPNGNRYLLVCFSDKVRPLEMSRASLHIESSNFPPKKRKHPQNTLRTATKQEKKVLQYINTFDCANSSNDDALNSYRCRAFHGKTMGASNGR